MYGRLGGVGPVRHPPHREAIALADRVVVFTARPGLVKTIVPVGMLWPRDLFSRAAAAAH
jgi:ABC-type nitrate/sulfonate/bicarbonate transport system ATPase subunit